MPDPIWSNILKQIWDDKEVIAKLNKRFDDYAIRTLAELQAERAMVLDSARAAYRRLCELEKTIRDNVPAKDLPPAPAAK